MNIKINKKSFTITVLNNRILIVLFILPFIEPIYLNSIIWSDKIFNVCYIFAILIAGIMLIENRFNLSNALKLLCTFFIFLCFSTIIHKNSLGLVINYIGKSLIFSIVMEYAIRNRCYKILDTLEILLEIIIIINFITIIVFPNGLYVNSTEYIVNSENWFMGFKNVHIRTMLPTVALSISNSYRKLNKIGTNSIFIVFLVFISVILINSSTAIVGMTIFILLTIVFKYNIFTKIASVKNALFALVLIFLGIYYLHIQNIFAFFLEDVLGKDLTFHNRLIIWKKSIDLIAKNPLLGIGYQPTDKFYLLLGAPHSHNYYLFTVLISGILGGIVMCLFYVVVSKKIIKYRKMSSAACFQAMVISIFIMGLTESLTATNLIYPMIIVGYHIDKLNYVEKKKKRYIIKIKR